LRNPFYRYALYETKISSHYRKIPNNLWNEIKLVGQADASGKKTKDTISRPAIPFRRVLDGMVFYTF
jgi:hypothetical protein